MRALRQVNTILVIAALMIAASSLFGINPAWAAEDNPLNIRSEEVRPGVRRYSWDAYPGATNYKVKFTKSSHNGEYAIVEVDTVIESTSIEVPVDDYGHCEITYTFDVLPNAGDIGQALISIERVSARPQPLEAGITPPMLENPTLEKPYDLKFNHSQLDKHIDLRWSIPEGAEYENVYTQVYRADSAEGQYVLQAVVPQNSYKDYQYTDNHPGIGFYYKLRFISENSSSGFSEIASTEAPLQHELHTDNVFVWYVIDDGRPAVRLQRDTCEPWEQSKLVRRTLFGGGEEKVVEYDKPTWKYIDYDVEPGKTYSYYLEGDSSDTKTDSVNITIPSQLVATPEPTPTQSATPTPEQTPTVSATPNPAVKVPGSPSQVKVVATGPTSASISWTKPSRATGYIIHRGSSINGPFTQIATLGNVSAYNDENAPGDATSYYIIEATNDGGKSMATKPQGVKLYSTFSMQLIGPKVWGRQGFTIKWTPISKAKKYTLYRSVDGVNYTQICITSGLLYTDLLENDFSILRYKVVSDNGVEGFVSNVDTV